MNDRKKILFLLLALPDMEKTSNLYSDLVREFHDRGENIRVVAPAVDGGGTRLSREKGIEVLRVGTMPLFNVDPIRKGIANMRLPYQFARAIDKHYKGERFDSIVIPTPPITLEKLASKLKKRDNATVYLILRDIFPQNAVDMGMMRKGSPLYKMFRRQEKRLYALSDHIGCMSRANIDYIRRHDPQVDPAKLHILMNFQKVQPRRPAAAADLKAKYGLGGKFVIVFGGNMGVPQKIGNVVAFAKAIEKEFPDAVLLLIGNGTQRSVIEKLAAQNDVHNIVVREKLPREDYHDLVGQCDVGLISLNERFTIPNIPSKTMAYFEVAIPILASVDAATDYGAMLEEHNMGLWSLAGDTASMVDNFRSLYGDPALRRTMGENGRRFLEENMRVELAYDIIMSRIG